MSGEVTSPPALRLRPCGWAEQAGEHRSRPRAIHLKQFDGRSAQGSTSQVSLPITPLVLTGARK